MTSTLDQRPLGEPARVHAVHAPSDAPDWSLRLEEIGFIPGEQVTLMARGMPGGDPLMVRVGDSTFALRRAEAACVEVRELNVDAADSAGRAPGRAPPGDRTTSSPDEGLS